MKMVEQINKYFDLISANDKKEVVKVFEDNFISASKSFIIHNNKDGLNEFFQNSTIQQKVRFEKFREINKIDEFLSYISTNKVNLINEHNKIVDIINNNNYTNYDKKILNEKRRNLLSKIENEELKNKETLKTDEDFVYVSSRIEDRRINLIAKISALYKMNDVFISDLNHYNKIN